MMMGRKRRGGLVYTLRRPPLQKAARKGTPAVTETSGVEAEGEDVRAQSQKGKTYACASCEDLFYKSEVRICNENNAEHDGKRRGALSLSGLLRDAVPGREEGLREEVARPVHRAVETDPQVEDAVGLVGPKRKGESRSAYRARLQNELKHMAEE